MIVEVAPCAVDGAVDFRLDTLFTTGSFPFGDAVELTCFWNGSLARAYGLPTGPLPERPAPPRADAQPQLAIGGATSLLQRAGKRLPRVEALTARLDAAVTGQQPALGAIARLAVTQVGKRVPSRPATALLLGPSGVGKTAAAEALADALALAGWPGRHVYRIDCNELTDGYDVHRLLGASPGLEGYTPDPPLIAELKKGSRIILLDEIDKAHPAARRALYGLLDRGRVTSPDGKVIAAPDSIILMTSADGADELAARLERVAPEDTVNVDRIARQHLRERHWQEELLGRIDTVAVFQALENAPRRAAAEQAIQLLAREYGLDVVSAEPPLAEVVLDLATQQSLSVRSLYYAARRVLGETFAAAAEDGTQSRVVVVAGPPPSLRRAG